ncbi:hypothetical protein CEXT_652391 [Caerostris extrusa]|uniref:Uncharacterized protein n=1 Tax=Caerostris extrusa TaxID=172846 RepID=A0AAV4RCY3_CAEEX|nr:hypothetical protein CEXT_652391 [Caerostris extrusa]
MWYLSSSNYQPYGKEGLMIYAFGRDEKEFDVYQLRIRSKQHPQNPIRSRSTCYRSCIWYLSQGPSKFQEIRKYMDQFVWVPADSSSYQEKIDILLGAEYFWNI